MSKKAQLERSVNAHAVALNKQLIQEARAKRRSVQKVAMLLFYNQQGDMAYSSPLPTKRLAEIMRAFADQIDPPKLSTPTEAGPPSPGLVADDSTISTVHNTPITGDPG
jgi:hypothetical protein